MKAKLFSYAHLLTAIGLSVSFHISAQSYSYLDSILIDETTNQAKYENIFDTPGTKTELYVKGKLWLSKSIQNTQAALQTDDKEEGIIVCRGTSNIAYKEYEVKKKEIKIASGYGIGRISMMIKMYFKDNKTKVVVTDIRIIEPIIYAGPYNYDISAIKDTKYLLSKDSYNQATGLTRIEMFKAIDKIGNELLKSIGKSLLLKSENEF